ncbi:MAG: lipoyl protein ligase domain-containing protein [Acidimicrobiales bacterium]
MTWPVVRWHGDAATFHARPLPTPTSREVWVCDPVGRALVLGSAQGDDVVDAAACAGAGVDVVRRRSGGGAVFVAPGELLWVDLLLPARDPLWSDDVGHAFLWVGDAWSGALRDLDLVTTVHRGGLEHSRWSSLVCFAGLGPGELTDPAGRKVVGLSQRRTRDGARFQCAALQRWDPRVLVDLLALDAAERDEAAADLATVATGLDVDGDALLDALIRRLP